MSSKLTVWYNTKCPVCNGGIEWQHGRLVRAARAGVIEFRDINLEPDALSRFGAGIEDVRRRLHAVDAEGRPHVGADCAIAIGLRTPCDAWLGRVLSLPVLHQIVRVGYDRFADLLYAWNRWQRHWYGAGLTDAGTPCARFRDHGTSADAPKSHAKTPHLSAC
jgi:predicted DCC family thiol-disulfide oxidoreductase YuxK